MMDPEKLKEQSESETLPASLGRAVDLLRREVPASEQWREDLLREVSDAPRPQRKLPADFLPDVPAYTPLYRRSFSVQPIAAIAAGILAMCVGGAGTLAFVNRASDRNPSTVVATAESSVPLVNAANTTGSSDTRQVIKFALVAPGATSVSLVGDFNNWDAKATPLKVDRDGNTWLVQMPLTAGRHVYAFVVDGDIVADPSAPRVVDHDFGVQNSVILVGSL